MIRVSDYLMKELSEVYNVKHVFIISGGGNMHLVDALGRNTNITYIPNHHEQACAIAAEAYSRVNQNLGVCLVTTGPGGTNALTGVLGAWLDSIPILIISGQVKQETLAGPGMRQLGDQEAPLVDMVKPITKYAVMVEKPEEIKYQLDKAIVIAKSGRPGPVWLDIPLDVQASKVDENRLRMLTEEERITLQQMSNDGSKHRDQVSFVIQKIKEAQRPVLFVGNGIRLAHGVSELQEVIQKLHVPVLGSFNGMDLVGTENPYFFGRPGTIGGRAANFILQNSDLFISIGSRLNIRIISFNYKAFAREAYKVVIDIDSTELNKKTLEEFDMKINVDAKVFLRELLNQVGTSEIQEKTEWLSYCNKVKDRYPQVTEEQKIMKQYVSAYYFVEKLSDQLDSGAVVTMGDGMACVIPFKTFKTKYGQRLVLNSGCAAMGYDLPAAIGACYAHGKRDTVCIAGDGSIMLNIQELQTIVHNQLPIKIFVLVNDGYLSIRMTQDTYFGGLRVGSDRGSGVSCPDFVKVAQAFGLGTYTITTNAEIDEKIKAVMNTTGPVLCTVNLDPGEQMLPKLSSEIKPDGSMVSKPLEDLYPFLPREEFRSNMLIPTFNE